MKKLVSLIVLLCVSAQAATPAPKKTEVRELVQNAQDGSLIRLAHDVTSSTYNFELCRRADASAPDLQCKAILVYPIKEVEFPLFHKLFQRNLAHALEPHLSLTGAARTAQTAFELVTLASNLVFAVQARRLYLREGGRMNGFSAIYGALFAVVGTFMTGRELYRTWTNNPEFRRLHDRFIEHNLMSNKALIVGGEVWLLFTHSLHQTLQDMLDTQLFAEPL